MNLAWPNDPLEVHQVGLWRLGLQADGVFVEFDGQVLAHVQNLGAIGAFFAIPDDELLASAHSGLLNEPTHYLVFGEGQLGLDNITSGPYALQWFGPEGDQTSHESYLDGGEATFHAPTNGAHLLYLRRTSR